MRLARSSCFLIASIVAGVPSTVTAQARAVDQGDVHFGCGKPQPIAGYDFRSGAHRFLLPKHVVINRNGQTIYSSGEQTGWEPPYLNVVFATSGTDVLIVAESTDCIDLTSDISTWFEVTAR